MKVKPKAKFDYLTNYWGTSSCLVRTLSALATRALLTVAAVSSIIGLAMSRTSRGFALKNVAAASAKINEYKYSGYILARNNREDDAEKALKNFTLSVKNV